MLATLMIVLPLVAAIVIWVAPLPREATAGLALLAALAEIALWIVALLRFDFASPALQDPHSGNGSTTSASPPRRLLRLLALARWTDRRARRRSDRLRHLGRA